MAPTYSQFVAPDVLPRKGFLMRPEYTVLYGGTLGATYVAPGVQIGTTGGNNLGLLDAFGFTLNNTVNPITGANVLESGLYEITAEEVTIQLTLKEWDLDVISDTFLNGAEHVIAGGAERLFSFGGGSKISYKPLVVTGLNKSVNAPSTQNIANGITGFIATFYLTVFTGSLAFDQLQANENKPLALEFRAVRDFTRTAGAQCGSIYFY